MDRKAIESLAVNAISDSISVCDHLSPYIADNDKEPSWDGNIYIYNDSSKKKDTLNGRVPVQVKGTLQSKLTKDEISFPVSTADLRNYLNDGGCMYLVVYIHPKTHQRKIYYSGLPPIKIRGLLSQAGESKTKSIKLKTFPDDVLKKEMLFFNCLENCRKQKSFSNAKLPSIEELEKEGLLEAITIPVCTMGAIPPQNALLSSEVYFYAQIKGSAILQPLEIFPEHMQTFETRQADIKVGNRTFYTNVGIIQTIDTITIKIGESFSILGNKKTSTLKYNYNGSKKLRILVQDLDFILSLIENNGFTYNGVLFPLDSNHPNYDGFSIDTETKRLAYCKKIVQVLDRLNCKKDLDISTLKEQDWKNINTLIASFIDKKPIRYSSNNLPFAMYMSIGPLNFILSFDHKSDNTYVIADFFDTTLNIVCSESDGEGEKFQVSQYDILHSEDFNKADNIRFDLLLKSFQSIPHHQETMNFANYFLLELLKAYDDSKSPEILNTAESFVDWLSTANEEELSSDVCVINQLQTKKRRTDLSECDKVKLYSLIEKENQTEEIITAAYLLLGQDRKSVV